MAKENNDISDLVKKCKILLLDIEGTTTSISFVKDKLFPYAEQNVKSFLESYWEEEDVKGAVAALRKLALEDRENNVDGAIVIPGEDAGREEQIEGLVNSVKWQMSIDRKAGPMKELQGLIWKVGYDKGEIKGHVYDDVSSALELWRSLEGQKVYIYSSGSVKAQKLLFRHSLVGDLLPHIEGHFDTAMGAKREAASYAAIAEKIGCKPEEILFLTDIVQEAEAAQKAGLQAALVSREGNAPLPAEAVSFPVLHSFEQLTVTNKRKPELQAEEVPAKVPKNDALDDVKTKTEMESELTPNANGSSEENGAAEKIEEPEKMEVEETSDVVAQTRAENVSNTALVNTNSASTEVDKVAVKDVPMVDAATDPAFVTDMKTVAVNTNASDGPKETAMKDATTETVDVSTPVMEIAEENNSAAKVQVAEMKADSAPVQSNPMDTLDEKATKAAIKAEESAKAAAQLKTEETPAAQAVVVDTLPQESKTSDTPIVEASPIETESMEIPIEEPNTTETPIAETKTQTLATKTTVTDAPAVEVTSVETTCQESASRTPPVESKFAVSKTQKALELQKSAADSKTETNAEVADSKAIEAEALVQDVTISDNLPNVTSVTDASIADEVAASTARPAEGEEAAEKMEKTVVEAIVEDDVIGAVDVPACEIEPVVEENVEKTDTNETEKMETEATEDVETDTEPKKPAESSQGDTGDTESTVIIQDITDDNQSLSEVTVNDIIDDLVPIVEEPSPMEEIDALQNAGDVLEKECDEILSKVQDVTNLDFIKPLHTITEEMETENIDSNDIVEGILDTEMDLNMKPCEDIDLNVVQEISETTTKNEEKTDDAKTVIDKPCKSVSNVEEKTEVKAVAEEKTENKREVPSEINNSQTETEAKLKSAVEDMESDNKIIEPESKGETETKVETAESISEPQGRTNDTEKSVDEPATEIKETEKNLEISDKITEVMQNEKENNVTQDAKTDTDAAETKVNGNSNGDTVVKVNGNSIKDDELTSRLSGDNSKEEVNGPNSDFANAEEGQGDNKVEPEIPDIKMKAVATDESRQPIEQPTEA